jgi:beta-galactosidase
MRWLVPDVHAAWGELPASVTVSSATGSDGSRLHVVHNWSWDGQSVATPGQVRDVLDPEAAPVDRLELGAWDVRVVTEA